MATSSKAKQTVQTEPNPDLQAALTDPQQDRAEQHVVTEQTPPPVELRSAEAPGIRTEAEVVADHQADNERASAAAAVPHTADPAFSTSAVKLPRVEDRDSTLYFRRKSDGHVAGVNEGTPEHARIVSPAAADEWEATTRPKADS